MIKYHFNKNLRILIPIILAILLISIILFSFSSLFSKKSIEKKEIKTANIITQFPLAADSLDLYSFRCELEKLIFDDYILSNGNIVEVSAECLYLDKLNNTQQIRVPIVIAEPKNNYRLLMKEVTQSPLLQWKDMDFIHHIEERYYYEFGTDVDVYKSPVNGYYYKNNTNKPTIDRGDLLLISFAKKESDIFNKETIYNGDYLESAKFNKDYINDQYGFENINNFINTGNPDELNMENNNLLIPVFVEYLEDINPS